MGIAKVTRNFQVTIPRDIRRIKGIKIGDTVFFSVEEGRVDFFKLEQEKFLREICGSWKEEIKGSSVDAVRALRGEWDRRSKRMGL